MGFVGSSEAKKSWGGGPEAGRAALGSKAGDTMLCRALQAGDKNFMLHLNAINFIEVKLGGLTINTQASNLGEPIVHEKQL